MNKKQKSIDNGRINSFLERIQAWFKGLASLTEPHPSVNDIGEKRRAQLLNIITLFLTATFILTLLLRPLSTGSFIALLLLSLVSYMLGRTKYYRVGAGLFTVGFISAAYIPLFLGTAGGYESAVYSSVPTALIVASVLVGRREFIFVAIYATLATFLAPYYSTVPTPDVLRTGGIVMVIGAVLYSINAFRENIERARLQEVQDINRELAEIQVGLEKRVAERTKALATSFEVSRRLATILDPRQLAVDVVEQVQSAFKYYHAHIYFVDEATGDLIMAGGTGEAGATMLARNHKIQKGRGLVGRAAETNAPVLVPDVSRSEGWLPNPLLPDTKSEAAIPISSGKQVLGVLDVQQNIVNGLSGEDVELLQSLAGQVAISLNNARSYEQSKSQAELESLVNAIGQKIQRATSVEDTLQTAIRELGVALGATRVSANIQAATSQSAQKESSMN